MAKITDELREWFESGYVYEYYGDDDDDFKKVTTPWFGWQWAIEDMLDRIDAEYEKAVRELNDYASDSVLLPRDADGVPIHIGDVMDGVDKYDSLKKVTGEVTTISFDATLDPDDSKSVGIRVWSDDRSSYHTAYLDPRASVYRHHHEPTVEDVLREFALRVAGKDCMTARPEVVEEYAAKLRLADDVEEQR